ncbi:LOW QUALITY PROTEIN: melanoma-associated antigen 8-like [Canis lupus familiaris]|uniref:LOW QUALITY PROTEIN: melanoma-associated antigen 8-like n=1 Tax=Canis lupus familiaris TaxID=9615 RepID=UPI0018F50317|nr:LOW QUALITY PROTEIN: melanoma-associated antigen 8-like [Canis lupus familiaris]
MPLRHTSQLWKLEEDPGEAQGLVNAQLPEAEDEDEVSSPPYLCSSSSSSPPPPPPLALPFLVQLWPVLCAPREGSETAWSPPQSPQSAGPSPSGRAPSGWSQVEFAGPSGPEEEIWNPWEVPEYAQPSAQGGDTMLMSGADLVGFLLRKYLNKQPTSQAEVLEVLSPDMQDAWPEIWGQACECMQLVFGVEVKEVDPIAHSYVLVTVLGLSYDGMLSGEQGLPTTGLLVLLLGVILLEGDRAPEQEVWEALGVMGVFAGRQHVIYGEPRELLTHVWVQEGYVEYRQVAGSNPARYEFLWGPRAHEETSKLRVMEYVLWVNSRWPVSSLAPFDEEEWPEPQRAARPFPAFGTRTVVLRHGRGRGKGEKGPAGGQGSPAGGSLTATTAAELCSLQGPVCEQ